MLIADVSWGIKKLCLYTAYAQRDMDKSMWTPLSTCCRFGRERFGFGPLVLIEGTLYAKADSDILDNKSNSHVSHFPLMSYSW